MAFACERELEEEHQRVNLPRENPASQAEGPNKAANR
jgi:hypothetical protein